MFCCNKGAWNRLLMGTQARMKRRVRLGLYRNIFYSANFKGCVLNGSAKQPCGEGDEVF